MDNRKYETFYIVPSNLSEEDLTKVIANFKEVVEKNGGSVEEASVWEKGRKFAYELNGHKDGTYVLMTFTGPSPLPNELNRLMRINDLVIRHRIDKLEA